MRAAARRRARRPGLRRWAAMPAAGGGPSVRPGGEAADVAGEALRAPRPPRPRAPAAWPAPSRGTRTAPEARPPASTSRWPAARSRAVAARARRRRPRPGRAGAAATRSVMRPSRVIDRARGHAADDVALDEEREDEDRDRGHHADAGGDVPVDRALRGEQRRGAERHGLAGRAT